MPLLVSNTQRDADEPLAMHYLIKTKSIHDNGIDARTSVEQERADVTAAENDSVPAEQSGWDGATREHSEANLSNTLVEEFREARTEMPNNRASWVASTGWWRKRGSVNPGGTCLQTASIMGPALSAVHIDKGITRTQNGNLVKAERPLGISMGRSDSKPWRYRISSWWCAWTDVEDPFTRRVHVSGFGESIHPHAPIYALWNNMLLFMMLYPFIIAPIQAGFGLIYPLLSAIRHINEVSLFLDIAVTFSVAVVVGGTGDHVEKRPFHVAKQYLSSWFIFDILTTVPWKEALPYIIGKTWVTETRAVAESLDLIKIFRFMSVARRSSFSLPSYGMKYAQRSTIVFVLLVMLVSHWMACAWMLMARVYLSWFPGDYESVWWSSADLVPERDSIQSQYIFAVYYSITIMATIGYGDITPQNGYERTLCIGAMVLGTMCYAYCITQLVEMVAHWHHADVRFKAHQDHLIEYMRARSLPMDVQKRILKFYDFQRKHTAVFYNESDILDQLTPRLKAEVIQVAHHDSVNLLSGLPLFEDMEVTALNKIIVSLRSSFLPPDEVVFVAGEVARQLYIIRKGVVAVLRDTNRPVLLTDGQSFGESVLYKPSGRRTATVMTHSYCQLMLLSKAAVDGALQTRPEQYQNLMQKAKLLYREHTRRSNGEVPPPSQSTTSEGILMQSSKDPDATREIGDDWTTNDETCGSVLGTSPPRGKKLWQKMITVRANPGESDSAAIDKLSHEIADLKVAVQKLLQIAQENAAEED